MLSYARSCATLCNPIAVAHQAPLSTGILQARILEWVAMPPPGDLPNPGTEPRSSALQVDSLLSELWGKPKSYFFSYHLMSPVIRLCSLPISGILHVRGKEYQGRKRLCGQHCGYLQSLLFNILFNHPPVWRGW